MEFIVNNTNLRPFENIDYQLSDQSLKIYKQYETIKNDILKLESSSKGDWSADY